MTTNKEKKINLPETKWPRNLNLTHESPSMKHSKLTYLGFLLFLTQPILVKISNIDYIPKIQELTLDRAPADEMPFTRNAFFSESHKIGLVTFHPEYNFEIWDVENNQYKLKTRYTDYGKKSSILMPISKTTYMLIVQSKKKIRLYDLNDLTGVVKTLRIADSDILSEIGGHIEDTNYCLTSQISGDYFWAMYDYTQAPGLITPDEKYIHPSADGKVNHVISIQGTANLFVQIEDISLFDNWVTQEYASKTILTQFDKSEAMRGGVDMYHLKNTNWILIPQITGGINIYDWTGDSGTAPVKKTSYKGFVQSGIRVLPGKNILVVGDYKRNNYFFLDQEKEFEFMNHQSYKSPEHTTKRFKVSFDAKYSLVESSYSIGVFKVFFSF